MTRAPDGPYQVISWTRGNHGIVDTRFEIGDYRRRHGKGFRHKRDAEKYVRDLNRKVAEEQS